MTVEPDLIGRKGGEEADVMTTRGEGRADEQRSSAVSGPSRCRYDSVDEPLGWDLTRSEKSLELVQRDVRIPSVLGEAQVGVRVRQIRDGLKLMDQ